jgi:hypothetical protein
VVRKALDGAGDYAKARGRRLVGGLEENLHANAYSEIRSARTNVVAQGLQESATS